ncbi:NADH dehydrogenase [ubiquinone] 1 alpha subcomplex subunit 9, mitochondrial isoform X2 [Copidosoma floridanum]|uniref:NADH dehydrogenase [ubiquinone] 1 alpha subcomplex subunit 9, mitochondrial isoform X2 n=1 Tax=Copidosoma floridanum TaxID=29053 RepID=UPI000C6FA877|nr:NADH dehydrogenase [ubiquinone] 1 alpha subcomplex subunit 9, mitochondrial isoform X2 [Copidosoma floridanum]
MAALIPKTSLQIASKQSVAVTSVAVQSSCNYSQKPHILKNPNLSNLKRGTGGRSSFNGIVCTIFGASGFIGKHVVGRLGRIGTQMIIPYRGDHYDVARLKVCGDLGQVLFHPFDLRDEESIVKCIKYSNVVINLIGRDYETKNFKYGDVHVDGAARIARLCKENGVDRLIHVSCLNATAEPKPILLPRGSQFFKSKWEGEWAVKKEYPEATIIRPSDVYGTEDRFIGVYGNRWRQHFRGIPLLNKGETVEKQPIWVGDVAAGIVAAIKDHKSAGRTYQFVGPKRYRLSDIMDYLHELLRRECADYGYRRIELKYAPLFMLKVKLTEALSPAYPLGYLHMEGLEKEHTCDNVVKGVPKLEDLGIEPLPINEQFRWEAVPFRFDGSYEYEHNEFGDIQFPEPIA